jgi:hypothetical protein
MLAPGVDDGDAEQAGRGVEGEGEPEVAAVDTTAQGGVGGEFGHDLLSALGDAG